MRAATAGSGGLHMGQPSREVDLRWKPREVHGRDGQVHWSMGDASKAWSFATEELERDFAAGSGVDQAQYWTIDLLIGEARHIREEIHVMDSITDHMLALVPLSCFKPLGRSDTVTHMSLADLFRFVSSTFDGEEGQKGEEARHFWNPIIHKGSEVEDSRVWHSGVARYSSTIQLLSIVS